MRKFVTGCSLSKEVVYFYAACQVHPVTCLDYVWFVSFVSLYMRVVSFVSVPSWWTQIPRWPRWYPSQQWGWSSLYTWS